MSVKTKKMKALTVIRLTVTPGSKGVKPVTEDIPSGTVFDCPVDLLDELRRSSAITNPSKRTMQEAALINSAIDLDKDDDDDDDDREGEAVDLEAMTKPKLVEHAKSLGLKPAKNWDVAKLKAEIVAAAADDDDDSDVM